MKKLTHKLNFIFVLTLLLSQLKVYAQPGVGPCPYCLPQAFSTPCNQPNASNNAGNFINDFINSFNTTGATANITNNNSGCNTQFVTPPGITANYYKHPCVVTKYVQTTPGQAITCNFQSGIIFSQGFAVWVDWNNDATFGAGEMVCCTPNVPAAGTWAAANWVCPAVPNGKYRLRVRCSYATIGCNITPCNQQSFGEAEDYTLFVGPVINCAVPITATLTSNAPLCPGATLSFTSAYTGVSGPATFTWSGPNGFTSNLQNPTIPNVSAANAGVYSYTVSDPCGVLGFTTLAVVIHPQPTLTPSSNSPICAGKTLSLTTNAQTSYTWTGPNSFASNLQNPTLTPAVAGNYTVKATSVNGCTNVAVTSVVVSPNPTATAVNNSPACVGANVTLTGGGGGTYSWTGPGGYTSLLQSPVISNIQLANAGNYSLVVTVGTCTHVAVTNVVVNPLPVVTPANTGPYCVGNTIFLSVNAASSYTWTGPNGFTSNLQNPNIPNAQVVNGGVYTVSVTSAFGCVNFSTTTVVVNPLPIVLPTNTGPYCVGNTISLSVGAGASYTWTGPGGFTSNLQNPTIANAQTTHGGVYTVTVTSVFGCKATGTTNVVVNPLPVPIISSNSPLCVGKTLNLGVGAALSYTWTGPNGFASNVQFPSVANVTAANAGVYTVSVTSALGCKGTATVNVVVNPLPIVLPTNTGPYCAGANIILNVGAASSYTWTGPNGFTSNLQNPTIANSTTLNSGVYTVSLTNVFGCIASGTTNVIVNPLPIVIPANTGPYCAGATIILSVGGAASYTWTGPNGFTSNLQNPTIANSQVVNGGVYTVSLTTAAGCINFSTTTVVVNPLPVVAPLNTGPYCAGATINLSVGAAASYTWTGPNGFTSNLQNPSIANAQAVNAGVYTVSLTTAFGCVNFSTTTVVVNPLPVVLPTNNGPYCVGNTISLSVGAAASYTWTGPNGFTSNLQNPTIANAQVANAGVYTVSLTTAFGCVASATMNVVVNLVPSPLLSSNSPLCVGNTLNLGVGASMSYTWTGPNAFTSNVQFPSIANVTAANAGVYTASVTSALGCKGTATINVVVNPLPIVLPTNTGPYCAGATINLSVGAAASYTWTGPNGFTSNLQNPSIANAQAVNAGVYTVSLTTAFGCVASSTTNVIVNPLPIVLPTNTGPYCAGATINLNVGAAASYTWTGPNGFTSNLQNPTIANAQAVNAGVYTVSLTTAFGCVASSTTNVIVNPLPIVLPTNTGPYCAGATINLNVGAAASYTWTGPNGFTSNLQNPNIANAQVVNGGVYTVSLTTAFGCVASNTTNVIVNPLPIVLPANTGPYCVGNTISLSVGAAASYTWTGPNAFNSNLQNPTVANAQVFHGGVYTVSLTTAFGCVASNTTNVVVNPLPVVLPANTGPYCVGTTINLSVGAAASYTWTGPSAFNSNLQNPSIANAQLVNGGTYSVSVTSALGCVNTGTTSVIVNPLPTATMTSNSPVCSGNPINLTVNATTSYTWTGPNGFTSNLQNPTIASAVIANGGNYSLTVTNAFGCTTTSVINVVVNPTPTITINPNPAVICFGNSINLTANGATAYTWTPATALNTTTGANVTANPLVTTNYTVLGSSLNCTNTGVITVTVLSLPSVTVTPSSPTLCMNNFNGSPNTVTLNAAGAASYTWGPITGLTTNTLNGSSIIGTSNGAPVATGTVIGANGTCTNMATFTVNAIPNPIIAVTSGSMCFGTSVNLTSSGANTYTWSPSATLNTPNGNAVTASPAVTTVYSVIGSSVGCQSQTQTGTASVVPNPTVTLAPLSPSICIGTSINLTANGATDYTWTPPATLNTNIGANVTANPTITTTYSVIGSQATCTHVAAITVTVVNLPVVSISASSPTLCMNNFNGSPNTVLFTAAGATTYTWGPITGITPNTLNGSAITGTSTGAPIVSVTVIGSAATCTNTASFTVSAIPNPIIAVTSGSMCFGTSVNLTSSGANTYTWSPSATLNTANGNAVTASPAVTTIYSVIGSSVGCQSQTQTGTAVVVPNPTVTLAPLTPSICIGNSINLSANGATDYTWTPAATLNTNIGANVTANPTITTVYTVIGSQATCTHVASITVNVVNLPVVSIAASSPTLCMDNFNGSPNTVVFTAAGATSYIWGPITGITPNTLNGSSITGTSTGAPIVSVTVIGSAATCTNTASFTVAAIPNPIIAVTSGSMCFGTSVNLTSSGANTYTWSPSASLNVSNGNAVTASPAVTTVYSVIGSSVGCNSQTQTGTASVVPNPTVTLAPLSPTICIGSSINLTASGASDYTWTPAASLNTNIGSNVTASPNTTTTYSVLGSQATCTHAAAITVTVVPLPIINIAAASPTICMNNYNGSPNTVAFTAAGASTYTWGPITGLTANTLNGSSIIGTSTGASQIGSVTVMGTALSSCTNVASFSVAIIPNPIIAVTSGSMCFGTSVNLSASGANSYVWSPSASLNTATASAVIASPSVTTVYSVIGSSVGCSSQTQNGTASVVPNPTPSIAPLTPTICIGTSINLTASGATDYTWTPANTLNTNIGANVTANPTVTTTYTVIGSQATCTNTAVRTVTVVNLPVINITTASPTLCMNNFNGSPNTVGITASGATSYTWTGFVGLNPSSLGGSSIIGTSILQSPIGTGSVIGMAATCTNVATFSVAAIPNPIISVSSATMCFGTSAVLNANGATSYVWSPAGTLSSNTGSSVIASPSVNMVYSVIGSSLGCNSTTETGSVGVVANPTITITSAVIATLCAGESVGLSGAGANTYTWLPSNLVDSPNSPNVIATPPSTTNYTLVGSANSCTSMAIKQVTVTQLPTLQAIAQSTAICLGSKTTLNANGAVNYTWMPTTGLSSPTLNFIVANPLTSIVYTLIGNNGLCTSSITVPIDVIQVPVMNLSTNLQKVCEGNSTSIFASGANSYTWSPQSSLQHISNGVVVATPSVSTNYTVMAVNYSGTVACDMTQEILIDVVPTITASISNSVLICEGESTRLDAGGRNTYVWTPPFSLNNANIPSPYASPTVSTIYTVSVSDAGFCAANATVLVQVSPKPQVNAGPDQILNLDEPMYLNASGTGTMTWIFGENILCHDCPNSQITPENSGDYIIETVNKLGCKAQDVVHIEVTKDFNVYIPNVFTPNFDGNNDVFLVYGTGITKLQMIIFDRWGERLFVSDDQKKGWDGTYQDVLSKNDVYVYQINYTTLDNKKHTKTGHVSLLK